ncbi:hypothetical protein ACHZ97_04240 [Lysobacter soli]|uniref:hypothetical protein n=1 Tax=Lysobacter soli TaxID=453783 RepID=UPI0037C653EA
MQELMGGIVSKCVPASGAACIAFFGVPQGMLVTAFLGAIMSFYFLDGMAEKRIWRIIFGVIVLAFAGGWVALALPSIGVLGIGDTAAQINPLVRAGLCALAFQSLWNLGHRFANRKVEGR